MSYFSDLDPVRQEMADQAPYTPRELIQHDIAQRLSTITQELDYLISRSRDFDAPDIQQEICAEEIAFWSVMTKAQLLCSFIESRKPQGLRLVSVTRR
jgi:hypothetical protein